MKDGWDKGAGEQRGRTRAVTNVLAELPLWAGPTNSRPPAMPSISRPDHAPNSRLATLDACLAIAKNRCCRHPFYLLDVCSEVDASCRKNV